MRRTIEPFLHSDKGLPAAFGKHVLLSKLATGGMGEVFLARLRGAAGFEKLLVLKRLLPHLSEQIRFVSMFLDEARIAARISHANVCQIYELGDVEGHYYMTMEYLEGASLGQVIERRRLDPRLADLRLVGGVLTQACEGLHGAHDLRNEDGTLVGVVHRDVCLSNIYVTWSGVAKILDFGVAKAKGTLGKTRPGAVKGTYAYMSPEQLRGEEVDPRSDVFALGAVAWEAITGRRLFKRKTDFQTFKAITDEPIPKASELRPEVPLALSQAVDKALSRDPRRRFQTARDFGHAINEGVEPLGPPLLALAIAEVMAESFSAEIDRHRAKLAAIYRGSAGEQDDEGDATEVMPVRGQRRMDTTPDTEADRATHPVIRMPLPAPTTTGTAPVVLPERAESEDGFPLGSVDVEIEDDTLVSVEEEQTDVDADADPDALAGADDQIETEEQTKVAIEDLEISPATSTPAPRRAIPLLIGCIFVTIVVIVLLVVRGDDELPRPDTTYASPSVEPLPPPPGSRAEIAATVAPEPPAPSSEQPAPAAGPNAAADARPADEPPAPGERLDAPEPADETGNEAPGNEKAPTKKSAEEKAAAKRAAAKKAAAKKAAAKRAAAKRAAAKKAATKKAATESSPAGKPPTPAKPKEPGYVTLDSTPYATIYLDGKKLGYTPIVNLKVPAGTHTIRAVSSVDGSAKTLAVTVRPGKHLRRKVKW